MEKLTEIGKLAVKYGPAVVEALAWLWTAVLRWLDGSADEAQARVADVLPRPLLSRLEMVRGRAGAEAIIAEELEGLDSIAAPSLPETPSAEELVASLRGLRRGMVLMPDEQTAIARIIDRVERGE